MDSLSNLSELSELSEAKSSSGEEEGEIDSVNEGQEQRVKLVSEWVPQRHDLENLLNNI